MGFKHTWNLIGLEVVLMIDVLCVQAIVIAACTKAFCCSLTHLDLELLLAFVGHVWSGIGLLLIMINGSLEAKLYTFNLEWI